MALAIFESFAEIYYETAVGAQKGARMGAALGSVGFGAFGMLQSKNDPNWKWKDVCFVAPFGGMAIGSIAGGLVGMAAGASKGIYQVLKKSLAFQFITQTI